MRAKTIQLPTYKELCEQAPQEIQDLIEKSKDVQQSKTWHPEGPLDIHQLIVYNRARRTNDINMTIAALFHDLGKVETTYFRNGKWTAHGHEFVSSRLVEKYKTWIESLGADFDVVYYIVKNHMRAKQIHEMRRTKRETFMNDKYYPLVNKFSEFDNMQTDYLTDIDNDIDN